MGIEGFYPDAKGEEYLPSARDENGVKQIYITTGDHRLPKPGEYYVDLRNYARKRQENGEGTCPRWILIRKTVDHPALGALQDVKAFVMANATEAFRQIDKAMDMIRSGMGEEKDDV